MRLSYVGRIFALNPWWSVLTIVLYTVYSCLPLLTDWLKAYVLDVASGEVTTGWNLWTLLVLLLVSRWSQNASLIAWHPCNWWWFNRMFAFVRQRLLGWLLSEADPADTGLSPGQVLNRFRDDTEQMVDVVNEHYRLISQGTMFVIAVLVLARVDAQLTLLTVVPLSLAVIIVHILDAAIARRFGSARDATERLSGFLGEAFGAALSLQLAGAVGAASRRVGRLADDRRRSLLHEEALRCVQSGLGSGIVHLRMGLILLLMAASIREGRLTIGDFALFVAYLGEMMEFPRRIGRMLAQQKIAGVAASRMGALMPGAEAPMDRVAGLLHKKAEPPLSRPGDPDPLQRLEVAHLTCRHPDSDKGIVDASLRVNAGELVVVTGRVASGKTTLLRGVLGLLPRQGGSITWNGRPIAFTDMRPPRAAYTPQVPRLFSETLRENVLLGADGGDQAVDDALRLAVMEPDVAALSDGLDTVVGPRGVRLSGGQIQRTAAARMFLRQAQVFVVDDLSSSLDVDTEATLWQRIDGMRQERSVAILAVSHRRQALQRADRVIVVDDGRIVDDGPLQDVLQRCPAMQDVWGSA